MKTSSPERADPTPVPAGGESVRGKRRARRLREIDFSRPTKFTQEQLRRIERAHESFCRTAAMRLTGEARTEIELEVVDLAQLTWMASLSELPTGSLYGIVKLEPGEMHMLVSTELQAVRAIVDRMLGSTELREAPAEQELTEIELAISRRVLDVIVEELSRTWEELLGLSLAVDWLDVQLQNLQLAPPSEPTIALTLQLRLEELTSSLSVVVPFRSIESEVGRLPTGAGDLSGTRDSDAAAAAALAVSLSETFVELRVEVASKELALADVLALKPGEVVGLDAQAETGVTLFAEVVPVHRARPGRRGNRRAVEVLERLEAAS
jgi:flagellar motor switch protein FliM